MKQDWDITMIYPTLKPSKRLLAVNRCSDLSPLSPSAINFKMGTSIGTEETRLMMPDCKDRIYDTSYS